MEILLTNPFRHVGEKLLAPAGETRWPLAVLYYNTETKAIDVAVAEVAAELLVGHGRKIGATIDAEARRLAHRPTLTPPGPKRRA